MTAPTGYDLYLRAMTQVHHPPYPYVFGRAPASSGDCHLGADCSGFTAWATGGWPGLRLPAGSWIQKAACIAHGFRAVAPSQAITGMIAGHDGQGADGHVVIVGPNRTTVEARGKAYGIGVWALANRPFQWAFAVAGFDYSGTFATPTAPPTPGPLPAPVTRSKESTMVLVPGSGPNPAYGNRVPYWDIKGKQIIAYNGAPLWQDEHGTVQSGLGLQWIDVPSTGDLTGLAMLSDGVTLVASASTDGGTFLYRTR